MPENHSTIALEINGQRFEGWESFSMEFDIETFVTSFNLSLYDPDSVLAVGKDDFPAGNQCSISITNQMRPTLDRVLDGFIVRRRRSISSSSNSLNVEGADKLVDLLDCSAVHPSRTWFKAPFSVIVSDLARPFGVTVVATGLRSDPIIDKFSLQSGESAFAAIERLCRSQAVLPLSDFQGYLTLGYAASPAERAAVDLEMGVNILSLDEDVDWTERYSEYTVLGQGAGNGKKWTKAMLASSATAKDTGITRYRPKIIIAENKATKEILIQRVNWEAQVRSGRSTEYNVTVRGWYQTNRAGFPVALWQKNQRVTLRYPEAGLLNEELLITKVTFSLDSGGELTRLTLKHPDIFKAQPGAVVDLS